MKVILTGIETPFNNKNAAARSNKNMPNFISIYDTLTSFVYHGSLGFDPSTLTIKVFPQEWSLE